MLLIGLIPFQTIFTHFCREVANDVKHAFFGVILLPQKLGLRIFFTNLMYVYTFVKVPFSIDQLISELSRLVILSGHLVVPRR